MNKITRYFVGENDLDINYGTEIINLEINGDMCSGNLLLNVFSWATMPSLERTYLPKKFIFEMEFIKL